MMARLLSIAMLLLVAATAHAQGKSGLDNLGRTGSSNLGRAPDYPGPTVVTPDKNQPIQGTCRILFPDRPASQQPPPGPCEELQSQVPPGATLIRGR